MRSSDRHLAADLDALLTGDLTEREIEAGLRVRKLTFQAASGPDREGAHPCGGYPTTVGALGAEGGGGGGRLMALTLRLLQVPHASERVVSCIKCGIRIVYGDHQVLMVSDLLATHWADDHLLGGWRDAGAEARDRLWRRHPAVLEMLTRKEPNSVHRTG